MKDLSIIIITRNRLEKLKRCIESVHEKLSAAEIIVVDNASTDGTSAHISSVPNLTVVRLDENVGVAKARNKGIEKSDRAFVMFLDDDAWIEQLDFGKIKDYFESDPKVGVIAPCLLYPNGKVQESVRSFPTIAVLFWRGSGLYEILPNVSFYKKYIDFDPSTVQIVDWTIGACQIIRADLFKAVGVLDEKYFFGYEDADFCYRLKKAGYKIVFWPQATVFHEYARSSAKKIGKPTLHHIASIFRFFYKRSIGARRQ